jgi:hypothetical protein
MFSHLTNWRATFIAILLTISVADFQRPAISADAERTASKIEKPASQATASDENTLRAVAEARRLLTGQAPLRWSSVDETPRRFVFTLKISIPMEGQPPQVSNYLVVRDGKHVSVLVSTAEGLPVYFLTDGLFVGVDFDRPGGLMLYDGGDPTMTLASAADGSGVDLDVSFTASGRRRRIIVDVASLLRAVLPKTLAATVGKDGSLSLKSERSRITLSPPDVTDKSGFGVGSVSIRTAKGMELTVEGFSADAEKSPRGMIGMNRNSIEALGLPIRVLTLDGAPLPANLLAPAGFSHAQGERKAAEKLQSLFARSATAPIPSTETKAP